MVGFFGFLIGFSVVRVVKGLFGFMGVVVGVGLVCFFGVVFVGCCLGLDF